MKKAEVISIKEESSLAESDFFQMESNIKSEQRNIICETQNVDEELKEIESGLIPDPASMDIDPATGQPMAPVPGDTSGSVMGATPQSPEIDEKKFETPTGGEI